MKITTLPNGFTLDLEQVHFIQTEFLRPSDVMQSKLVINCADAEVTLCGTRQEIIDTRNMLLTYLNE